MNPSTTAVIILLLAGTAITNGQRESAAQVLDELRSIRDSFAHHVSSVKFVGVIRFFAIDALRKDPEPDPILVKRVENQFDSYFDKVCDFDGDVREDGVHEWIKEEPVPKDEGKRAALASSSDHLKESLTSLTSMKVLMLLFAK